MTMRANEQVSCLPTHSATQLWSNGLLLPAVRLPAILAWLVVIVLMANFGFVHAQDRAIATSRYFGIQVVDSRSRRGVPMVQLRTVNGVRCYSDSAGWVAFHEPGLMNCDVYFHVSSHGYEFPADGFGYRGVRLKTTPGATTRIEIERKNLAERMYRITGQGVYRDSVLLGRDTPTANPTINGKVLGQDTVQAASYHGQIYWFWGDTNRPAYPLGQFNTSGAKSTHPDAGGLTPDVGVDLQYFIDETGFSRPMVPSQAPGAIWLHGLFVLQETNHQQLIAHYSRVKTIDEKLEHGLVLFNDSIETFEKLVQFSQDAILYPRGQALHRENGVDDYIYFCTPFPSIRVRAKLDAILDPTQYESFTCLKPGTQYPLELPAIKRDASGKLVVSPEATAARRESAKPQLDVDGNGNIIWDWKANTGAIDASQQQQLIQHKHLAPQDARMVLVPDNSGKLVYLHAGSVHWNSYRRKWILLGEQLGGESSFLGEIWYAESDRLEGPWLNARHIVSHNRYSFYNPAHHTFLDQQGGRLIYFEGTYADTFSAAKTATPRYNYNQMMYRLDLSDSRLALPIVQP